MRIIIELSPEQSEKVLATLARLSDVAVHVERKPTALVDEQLNGAQATPEPDDDGPTLEDVKAAIKDYATTNPTRYLQELQKVAGVRKASLIAKPLYQQVIDHFKKLEINR